MSLLGGDPAARGKGLCWTHPHALPPPALAVGEQRLVAPRGPGGDMHRWPVPWAGTPRGPAPAAAGPAPFPVSDSRKCCLRGLADCPALRPCRPLAGLPSRSLAFGNCGVPAAPLRPGPVMRGFNFSCPDVLDALNQRFGQHRARRFLWGTPLAPPLAPCTCQWPSRRAGPAAPILQVRTLRLQPVSVSPRWIWAHLTVRAA